ncbi:EAL domain-containing protein [Yersinia ruckeri]|uniref:EAL domain-containing protein n=1 Tax=Yersinia ruckeri TaxID=29486 RepID=UPI0022352187|nr:EAL domain-containing protein [Yersinia ruckeri]
MNIDKLIDQLVLGIENNEFLPFIQPIIDVSTQEFIGGEILIRWNNPRIGLILPEKFISTAEVSGLIIPITEQLMSNVSFILKHSCYHASKEFIISFNLTEKQLIDINIVNACQVF